MHGHAYHAVIHRLRTYTYRDPLNKAGKILDTSRDACTHSVPLPKLIPVSMRCFRPADFRTKLRLTFE